MYMKKKKNSKNSTAVRLGKALSHTTATLQKRECRANHPKLLGITTSAVQQPRRRARGRNLAISTILGSKRVLGKISPLLLSLPSSPPFLPSHPLHLSAMTSYQLILQEVMKHRNSCFQGLSASRARKCSLNHTLCNSRTDFTFSLRSPLSL